MTELREPQLHVRDRFAEILAQPARLDRIEVSEVVLPLVTPFRSAVGTRTERRALFVRWFDRDGCWGIGECSCRPDPFYSGEFVDGAKLVIEQFMCPLLRRSQAIADVLESLARSRGWSFTAAAIEEAMWDCRRRAGHADLVDAWPGSRTSDIPVGISLGIFETRESAIETVGRALQAGYRRVKLKISPSIDLRILFAIRERFPKAAIAMDANGSFDLDRDRNTLQRICDLDPIAIEQPFPPGRLDWSRRFKQLFPTSHLCLDESITDVGLARTAWQFQACDEINIKPGRLGGQTATMELLDFCSTESIPAWVGGMFETGVGRTSNLRIAGLLPQALAHDLSPSARYFSRDVLETPLGMRDGAITLDPTSVGTVLDQQTIDQLTVDKTIYRIQ